MPNEIQISRRLLSGLVIFLVASSIIGIYAIRWGNSAPISIPQPQSNPSNIKVVNQPVPPSQVTVQDISIHANADGTYDKNAITVKKDVPVRLHFTADPNAGCGRQLVVYGLNVKAISRSGEEQIAEFTPTDAGTFEYSCGMRMWGPGKLTVQ